MKNKKILSLLLAVVLMLSFTACSSPSVAPEQSTIEPRESATVSKKGSRIVTDVWGREVEIPDTVESIICLGSGAPRMAAYLNVMDMLIGTEEHDLKSFTVLRDYNPVYHDTFKELPVVGAGGGSGNNNGYPEEIIMLAPDVILAGFSQEAADELYSQTGIPVVCVRYISNGLANDTFYAAMRVFAQVVGEK